VPTRLAAGKRPISVETKRFSTTGLGGLVAAEVGDGLHQVADVAVGLDMLGDYVEVLLKALGEDRFNVVVADRGL